MIGKNFPIILPEFKYLGPAEAVSTQTTTTKCTDQLVEHGTIAVSEEHSEPSSVWVVI